MDSRTGWGPVGGVAGRERSLRFEGKSGIIRLAVRIVHFCFLFALDVLVIC